MAVQASYALNPAPGFLGAIAEPNSPHRLEAGILVTGGGRTNPHPGDAMFYDISSNGWRTPDTAAESVRFTGILSYRADQVADANSFVEFTAGDEIQVITMGAFWLVVNAVVEYGSQLQWDRSSPYEWQSRARVTSLGSMHAQPVTARNRFASVADEIIKADIGFGRII